MQVELSPVGHSEADTIAAIATPSGAGAIGIIRISGARAREIARCVVRSRLWMSPGRGWRLGFGVARCSKGEILDQVLVLDMPAPRSYTGDDVVELQCHGGILVTQRILEAVVAAGARIAEPGEFTRRAFLNGRLDLTQAEAVAALIAARDDAALRLALRQLSGALGLEVKGLRAALVDALAVVEGALDFSAEELDEPQLPDERGVAQALEEVSARVERLLATYPAARAAYEGGRVVIVGKPNVGKSSLFNALLGRDRALVTPLAGTTRDVVEAELWAGGFRLVVADTAGLGSPRGRIDAKSMDLARAALNEASLALAVFDASAPLTEDDLALVRALEGKPTIAALNKSDLARIVAAGDLLPLLPQAQFLPTSAVTGSGIDELRKALAASAPALEALPEGAVVFAARHRVALEAALAALRGALRGLGAREGLEVVAVELRQAAHELGTLTGEVATEEILDRVFERFCVGK